MSDELSRSPAEGPEKVPKPGGGSEGDLTVDVCISYPEGNGRRKFFFTNAWELLQTLRQWQERGVSGIMLTWGKTPDQIIDRVGRLIDNLGVRYTVPSGKRSLAGRPGTSRRRVGRRLVGNALAGIGSVLMVVGGLVVVAILQPGNYSNRAVEQEIQEIKFNSWLTQEEKIARLEKLKQQTEQNSKGRFWLNSIVITVGSLMGAGGALLRRFGTRLAAPRAEEVEQDDLRAPVLLLRSFTDDAAGYVNEYRLPGLLSGMQVTGLANSMEPIGFEEMLAEEFGRSGPVLAIGRPGEKLPPVGAARTWLSHDDWQARVTDYLGRCRFAVMIVGVIKGNDGLAWELQQVLDSIPPEKVIFVMPPLEEEEAKTRWTEFHNRSGGRLPRYQQGVLAAGFSPDGRCAVMRAEGRRFGLGKEYREAIQKLMNGQAHVEAGSDDREGSGTCTDSP